MNDRYLFRAKRIDNGEWEIGNLVTLPNGEYEIANKCQNPPDSDPMWKKCVITHKVDPTTLCQCTGLKDKAGNLIFENDIVACDGCVGIVKFGYYEWSTSENVGFYIDWEEVYFRKDLAYWLDKIKVVGSIFDNPEPLEVE